MDAELHTMLIKPKEIVTSQRTTGKTMTPKTPKIDMGERQRPNVLRTFKSSEYTETISCLKFELI